MERGSVEHGPKLDDEMKEEVQEIGTSGKESRVEDERELESAEGHRVSGSGSSADEYTLRDHGEVGGRGHPKSSDKTDTA